MLRMLSLGSAIAVLLCVEGGLCVGAPPQAPSPRTKQASDQPTGDKYDMARLLKNLETIKTMPTMLNQPILIKRLTRGTLTFQPTPADLESLRKAGASEDVIKLISRKAGLPEPTPPQTDTNAPPTPKQGRLTVSCKPVDCMVSINQKEIGLTTKGELKDRPVETGTATVSALAKN